MFIRYNGLTANVMFEFAWSRVLFRNKIWKYTPEERGQPHHIRGMGIANGYPYFHDYDTNTRRPIHAATIDLLDSDIVETRD